MAAAIVIASFGQDHVEESISDYFHTPARLVLVASLVGMGFGMMVMYSRVWYENLLLNVAGGCAPVVAFAATTQPQGARSPLEFDVTTPAVNELAATALPAYFLALIVLSMFVYVVHPEPERLRNSALSVLAVVVAALLAWVMWRTGVTRRKVHVVAAAGTFAPLIALVFMKARGQDQPRYRAQYYTIASFMLAAVMLYIVDRRFTKWEYGTLVVEVVLIVGFAYYWMLEYQRVAPEAIQEAAAA